MEELKPCPICGSTPLLSAGPYDWDGGGRYYYYSAAIECACGLTLEVDNPRPREHTNYTKALDFAIAAWNKRAERTCTNELQPDKNNRNFFKCSACGCTVTDCEDYCVNVYTSDGAVGWSYCPHCGAKVVDS